MKTSTAVGVVAALAVVGGVWYWLLGGASAPVQTVTDYKSATYIVEGQPVTLVDGRAEAPAAPGSASKVVTQYFGNEATGDLNGDGVPDVAFLLTQNSGGSGTFYYVTAAIKTTDGYRGTDAVLLGDRVAPQTTEIRDGKLIVNYAERRAGEPMTTQPSEGKSLFLKLDSATMQFGIVAQNFEGEADPSRMTLGMKTWKWISTRYNNDTTAAPQRADAFTLTLKSDGTFSATTDCNGIGGNYSVEGKRIVFSQMISTLMYCDGSQEGEFKRMLTETQSYLFTSKGELILDLKLDSGSVTFR